MFDKQKTIAKEVSLTGIGLHSGKNVTLTFRPASEYTGFVFVRTDIEGHPNIEADVSFINNTQRSTTLEKNGVKIHTIEHVLASLTGMDLDNVIIELDNVEPPIMDGSAKDFVEALEKVGIIEQNAERKYYSVKEIISYTDPETGGEITLLPADHFEVTTMVDFGTKVLGTQNAILKKLHHFKEQIANARTFCFFHELEHLVDKGLIKGGDLNNAIVYVDRDISPHSKEKLKKIFNKQNISILPNGTLNNLTLHYPNEAARHKLLDVIGDLSLVGIKLKAKVIANKPGHHINTQFAKILAKHIRQARRKGIPTFDLTKKALYDINDIMKILPHRPPFILVDRVLEITDRYVVGVKNVTINEPFFTGHFPQEPVMPGVLQIEAMAQVGGIFVLNGVDDPQAYSTYFLKINKAKFKQKVVPGDILIFKMDLLEPIRRGIVRMQGYGYVNDKVVVEAEVMAQVVKTNFSNGSSVVKSL
ncbi:MAG: bifunctional UDP-3-O-[3-hydroxymyristoyl] N-acetylglucosamine deacetylase/3-hydroxyacyl-ACP dehydratase [Flavobacteriales bacterium AspAUS03]